MRTFPPGRQALAAPMLAVLTLLAVGSGADRTLAEEMHKCLMSEADRWFGRLAVSIVASEIDPGTVDDAYVARESKPIVAKCADPNGQLDPAADAQFQAYMARWSYHLDTKLQKLTTRGASD